MENKTIYHSAFGGDLVFEPNDKYLEHANDYGYKKELFDRDRELTKYKASIKSRDRENEFSKRKLRVALEGALETAKSKAEEKINNLSSAETAELGSKNHRVAVQVKIDDIDYISPWYETRVN